jgi:hypothetical protein
MSVTASKDHGFTTLVFADVARILAILSDSQSDPFNRKIDITPRLKLLRPNEIHIGKSWQCRLSCPNGLVSHLRSLIRRLDEASSRLFLSSLVRFGGLLTADATKVFPGTAKPGNIKRGDFHSTGGLLASWLEEQKCQLDGCTLLPNNDLG